MSKGSQNGPRRGRLAPDEITIAVTVYDRRQYLAQAIESALNQTLSVRVIVVEDCGPDPALQGLVQERFGSRIEYFRNSSRRGLFGNLNALAMEPLGRIAGVGAAVIGSLSTLISLLLGTMIGQSYNGTVLPLVGGFAILSIIAFFVVGWALLARVDARRALGLRKRGQGERGKGGERDELGDMHGSISG